MEFVKKPTGLHKKLQTKMGFVKKPTIAKQYVKNQP